LVIFNLDLKLANQEQLGKITKRFKFNIQSNTKDNEHEKHLLLHGFCFWFEVEFDSAESSVPGMILSTAPGEPETHWKQIVVALPDEFPIDEGTELTGIVCLERDENNHRLYNISLELGDSAEIKMEGHPEGCDCIQCNLLRECLKTKD